MIPIEQAFQLIDENVSPLPTTTIPLASSVGSVLASDILSDVNSPPHDKSMMDGFAVISDDVNNGIKNFSIVETIIAGDWPQHPIESGQASRIMTGAPLPKNADAVVMVEQTESTETGRVQLLIDSITPEKNILRQGVNFKTGQTVLAQGHLVRATDIGLLAEVGAGRIPTREKPTVAVLPTGNELVNHETMPRRGQIRNSNGPMLVALAQQFGLDVTDLGSSVDDPDQMADLIETGLNHDVLLLSGGVSAGTMDLVPGILKDLGVVEIFHKVAVKPGKPIWFGVSNRENRKRYVFGLPGNPVSSLVGFQLFVRQAIEKMLGSPVPQISPEFGVLHTAHETRGNRPTYWPGKRVIDAQTIRKFEPLVWRGSSDLFALAEAEGLIKFQENSTAHPPGEKVEFFPFV